MSKSSRSLLASRKGVTPITKESGYLKNSLDAFFKYGFFFIFSLFKKRLSQVIITENTANGWEFENDWKHQLGEVTIDQKLCFCAFCCPCCVQCECKMNLYFFEFLKMIYIFSVTLFCKCSQELMSACVHPSLPHAPYTRCELNCERRSESEAPHLMTF